MCKFVCNNKFFRPAQVYLYLKSQCDGKIKLTGEVTKKAARVIGCTTRTINDNIKKLIERNWIGLDLKSKICFVRGFEELYRIESWGSRTGAIFTTDKVKYAKGFFIGTCIGYLARHQKRKKYLELKGEGKRSSVQRKVRAKQGKRSSLPTHYPVACKAIAQIYNISISTALLWRKEAFALGFIDLKPNITFVSKNKNEFAFRRDAMDEKEACKLFISRTGLILMRHPYLVRPNMSFNTRRKPK